MQDVLLADDGGRYGAPDPRRRSLSFVLALAMSLALLAALVSVGLYDPVMKHEGGTLTAVTLSAAPGEKSPEPPAQQKAAQQAQASSATPPPATRAPQVVVPTQQAVQWPEGFIPMSRSDFAATDIGKIKGTGGAAAGAQASAGGGGGGKSGSAPDGSKLYNAQWYREPRDAEINGYLRPGQSTGKWAEISCRTVAAYHVEDCEELDESPRGSGMARVLRQAAWQFLVRPPRENGKVLVGAWVRIHFDFISRKRSDDAGGGAADDGGPG